MRTIPWTACLVALMACSSEGGGDGERTEPDPSEATQAEVTCPPAKPTFRFDTDIQKDVDNLGCTATSCHGAGTGGMRLAARATDDELAGNYEAFKARASSGADSLVLQKPAGLKDHEGGKKFEKGDATYTRWLTWIGECAPR